jgi:hypothetical protein
MRFLCITQNHGLDNTALSQPGRDSGGAKPLERRHFSIIGRCTFSPSILGMQFFLFFPRKSFLNLVVKITLYPKRFILISSPPGKSGCNLWIRVTRPMATGKNSPFSYKEKKSRALFRRGYYEVARVHGDAFNNFPEVCVSSRLS